MLRRKTRRASPAGESTLPGIRMKAFSMLGVARTAGMACLFAGLVIPSAFAAKDPAAIIVGPARGSEPGTGGAHSSKDVSGFLETNENLTLRLNTDLGSVHVVPLQKGATPVVRYSVHIETDARDPLATQLLEHYILNARNSPSGIEITGNLPQQVSHGANSAQFWVHFEVSVPASYGLDISTGAGDILTSDVGGAAALVTEGGNIVTGQLSTNLSEASHRHAHSSMRAAAKLQTQGGHIQVEGAAGDLNAFTAGGHINTGFIHGEANLHSGGGHIRAAGIGGKAELTTEGGNITVGKAGSFVAVKTGGGQIDFGEVRGSVHAQTGGGGIRVMYVSGPMDVESSGGSICLTRVSGSVQAATSGGTITAWINPDSPAGGGNVHLAGASQLSSGNGDIILFLPRNLAANIDAMVMNGGEGHIEADPALHLTMQASGHGSGQVHAMGVLNGGGAPLKLRTTAGKIRLKYLDSDVALHQLLVSEQVDRLNKRLTENGFPPASFPLEATRATPAPSEATTSLDPNKTDWLESWLNSLEIKFRGGMTEDFVDFKKRLVNSPTPTYPALAQRAGLQGFVKLQVRVKKDGSVEVQKLLEGEPALADAAIAAVKLWRAKPAWMNGQPVEVISTVTFNFQLH